MKNATRIILASLIVAVGAAAGQESTAGFKAGPMLSFAGEGSTIYNASNLIGLKAGFFYAHRLSDVISLQPEVQFALKGAGYYSNITRHEESVHFNYLEVSLLVNARVASNRLEFFAGPYAALLLSHTPLDETHVWTWRENELKGHDFGACLGARFWWRDFSLELQFMRGFVNVLPEIYLGEVTLGHYNTAVAVQIGYRLIK